MWWRRVVGLGLAVAVAWLFLPATHGGWLNLDDETYVVNNPLVRGGLRLDAVASAFVSTRGSLWIPLAWVSHMLDVSLFGMDPAGHHLTSVLLHAANAVVLAAVLAGLTGAPVRSLLVAALFAVHPLRVESVAWVTERKDLLVALFAFLTIGAWRRWTERPSVGRYLAVLGCYAPALASKPMAVTLPVLLLLLDYWPLARGARLGLARLVLEKMPLAAVAAASALVTLAIAGQDGLLADVHGPGERVANAIVSFVRYVGLMIRPVDLGVYYPFPPPWPPATVVAAAATLLALGACTWGLRARAPYLVVGYAWYLVALVPVIGVAQAGGQGLADRFTYLPMIGLLVAVVWGAADLVAGSAPQRMATGAAAAVVLGLLCGHTRAQLHHWRSAEALYAHTLAVTEGNWLIHQNLGELQLRRGALEAAITNFEAALAVEPRYANAAYNLGVAYTAAGRPDEARVSYRRALAIDPSLARAHNNLGALLLRAGEADAAIGHFATALRLDPASRSAAANFRRALAAQGIPAPEIEGFVRTALRQDARPRHGQATGAGEIFDQ